MLSIKVNFRRIEDVSLAEIYDETGVYVLWNAHAMTIPSYIGEGNILKRFTDHLGKPWARRPLSGTIAITSIDQSPDARAKYEAVFVEMALLDISESLGQWPKHNKQVGKESGIRALIKKASVQHKKFKITITGQNPLKPEYAAQMSSPKIVIYELQPDGTFVYDHNFRRRS